MIAYVVQDLVYGIADASRFFVSLPLSGGLVPYLVSLLGVTKVIILIGTYSPTSSEETQIS